jgi:hypothetical protein
VHPTHAAALRLSAVASNYMCQRASFTFALWARFERLALRRRQRGGKTGDGSVGSRAGKSYPWPRWATWGPSERSTSARPGLDHPGRRCPRLGTPELRGSPLLLLGPSLPAAGAVARRLPRCAGQRAPCPRVAQGLDMLNTGSNASTPCSVALKYALTLAFRTGWISHGAKFCQLVSSLRERPPQLLPNSTPLLERFGYPVSTRSVHLRSRSQAIASK